jgi:rod shape-determining protein MreC
MNQYFNPRYQNSSSIKKNLEIFLKKFETIFLIILCILFLTITKNNRDLHNKISLFFIKISLPIVKIINFPFDGSINSLNNFHELIIAKEENIKLKQENIILKNHYLEMVNLKKEYQEIDKILQINRLKFNNFKIAKFIGRSGQIFNNHYFINIGLDSGVVENSIVLGKLGIIGRVVKVEKNRSIIILITDSKSKIPVISENKRIKGIIAGKNNGNMEILYLQKNHFLKVGEKIFTSGDGDIMPSGILVGSIVNVNNDVVEVKMAEDVGNLDYIAVVVNEKSVIN